MFQWFLVNHISLTNLFQSHLGIKHLLKYWVDIDVFEREKGNFKIENK